MADGLQDALAAVDLDDPESVAAFVADDPGFRDASKIVVDISVLVPPRCVPGTQRDARILARLGRPWERYVYRCSNTATWATGC